MTATKVTSAASGCVLLIGCIGSGQIKGPTVDEDAGETPQDPQDSGTTRDRGSDRSVGTAVDGDSPDVRHAELPAADTAGPSRPQAVVLTQHNDNGRSGANLAEVVLNTSNVKKDSFGLLFNLPVDGQVYAQPLYIPGVTIAGKGTFNVLYVATQKNKVYAFDADKGGAPLWTADFATYARAEHPVPHPRPELDTLYCPNYPILPHLGITSTPVVDAATSTLYVEAFSGSKADGSPLPVLPKPTLINQCPSFNNMSDPGARFAHTLHALDLGTGQEKLGGPVVIQAQAAGKGAGSDGTNVKFVAKQHLQRPGLLLQNGFVYLGFGSFSDTPPYYGWVLGYSARNLADAAGPLTFLASPNWGWSGIWQAGQGLVGDRDGNIYAMTGNGNREGAGSTAAVVEPYHGHSFIKLPPTLGAAPTALHRDPSWRSLDDRDLDLGSSGPLIVPGTDWLVGGGKEGAFYSFDRITMRLKQKIYVSFIPDAGHSDGMVTCGGPRLGHIHGGPVHWKSAMGSWIYLWAEYDVAKAFALRADGTFEAAAQPQALRPCPTATSCAKVASLGKVIGGCGMPGGMLAISADGDKAGTGILWANHQKTDALHAAKPAALYAFDASDLTKKLWDSDQSAADAIALGSKNAVPTVANGRVYLGTAEGNVKVYGLKAP